MYLPQQNALLQPRPMIPPTFDLAGKDERIHRRLDISILKIIAQLIFVLFLLRLVVVLCGLVVLRGLVILGRVSLLRVGGLRRVASLRWVVGGLRRVTGLRGVVGSLRGVAGLRRVGLCRITGLCRVACLCRVVGLSGVVVLRRVLARRLVVASSSNVARRGNLRSRDLDPHSLGRRRLNSPLVHLEDDDLPRPIDGAHVLDHVLRVRDGVVDGRADDVELGQQGLGGLRAARVQVLDVGLQGRVGVALDLRRLEGGRGHGADDLGVLLLEHVVHEGVDALDGVPASRVSQLGNESRKTGGTEERCVANAKEGRKTYCQAVMVSWTLTAFAFAPAPAPAPALAVPLPLAAAAAWCMFRGAPTTTPAMTRA
ncbi:hypothetical protein PG984_014194 [Apiospora sp. TS-2023a]